MIDFSEQTFGVRICPNPRLQLCLIRFPGAAAVVIHSKTVNGVALTCSELAASAAIDAGELFRLQRKAKRDGPRHTRGDVSKDDAARSTIFCKYLFRISYRGSCGGCGCFISARPGTM